MPRTRHPRLVCGCLAAAAVLGAATAGASTPEAPACQRTLRASVVALDQAMWVNRMGATRPGGMLFALAEDVVSTTGTPALVPGHVQLRPGKRPRPLVLRMNVGDCLDLDFQNLLGPARANPIQPVTRSASIHVTGLAVREDISSDGVDAGANPASGAVAPGGRKTYRLYAAAEGSSLLYSAPGDFNGFATMQVNQGLFGAVNVEPGGSEWYRSQVTEDDMRLATRGHTPARQPLLHYDAVYPPGHAQAGRPILRMLDADGRLRHSDLTAVVTGPARGPLPGGPGTNPILPERNRPFREVTIHYHEAQDVIQAFPQIYALNKTISIPDAGYDGFAINYGTAGIAAEILSNRLGVGPAAGCTDCKFEEFFLSSWVLGDPGLLVDVPANSPCTGAQLQCLANQGTNCGQCTPAGQPKATRAYFPDDPSNVYHSYVGDHVRFRVLHAGASVHHVHHHHAHQWLFSAGDEGSNYLDSQSIGPGSSFTAELVYNGSGNRNLTVGDSIFHCHFYPHFASGMWALYRVHDVFEAGTPLDEDGRPSPGTRALPDGEIIAGTPIPAIVPIPATPMPPMPSPVSIVGGQVRLADDGGFPGYPFYIPGIAGHRPPHPPFDFAVDAKTREAHDGGLPRHLVTGGVVGNNQFTTLDWSKDLVSIDAFRLPEAGTAAEKRAFRYFGQRLHPSFTPEGKARPFEVNGLPRGPQPGSPYADPAVVAGRPVGNPKRTYKGVNLQLDAVFNKAGWHFPQQRIMALWDDVPAFVSGKKPPEPLFFRAAENDVVEYWHTNLVPSYYELDDFQVRTPTDILGQHIHLVKFDVTSSDGAANGFNYEDGTFSPQEVRERIEGINAQGGLRLSAGSAQRTRLEAKGIPQLGLGPGGSWLGAQATVQRWWVDPLATPRMTDRTYMTVFTHDHFGPSTHQMVGLYGGLLVEPAGTTWTSPDGRTRYGTRHDGGPTGYAANVLYKDPARSRDNYREFALEWGDTQSVYLPQSRRKPDCYSYTYEGRTYAQEPPLFDCQPVAPGGTYLGWADPKHVINCINCAPASSGGPNPPQPSLINVFGSGLIAMNYRNEPLALRVFKPASGVNPRAGAEAGDLAFSLRSIERFDPAFSRQPVPGAPIDPGCTAADCFRFPTLPISAGMGPLDPYTPLLHAQEGDNVQIRLLVGSHTSMHDFALNGLRWKWEPFDANSGYKSSQFILLSEHFEALFKMPRGATADYLYNPGASYEGLINGNFGLLRTWSARQRQPFLAPLRPPGAATPAPPNQPPAGLSRDCDKASPCLREFEVHAMTAQHAFPEAAASGLVYNSRGVNLGGGRFDTAHPLVDPFALVYVLVSANGRPVPRPASPEPLVLRVAAGDWIRLRLVNTFTGAEPVFTASEAANRWAQIPYAFPYGAVPITTSAHVGLHAQLLEYDVARSDGMNVGANAAVQTAPPRGSVEYLWYAGKVEGGKATPVEFGAVNLMPADPVMQVYRGLFGALVVEPAGATWAEDPHTRTSATVWSGRSAFREQVLIVQNDVNLLLNGNSTYAAGGSLTGFNYRTEPAFLRYGKRLDAALGASAPADWTKLSAADVKNVIGVNFNLVDTTSMASNALVGGDPQTPVFAAPAGMPVRFRLLAPGGIGDNQQTFELTGHVWQKEPWADGSTRIARNPGSEWTGTQTGVGPPTTYEVVLEDGPGGAAGGRFHVPGDYLYRSWVGAMFQVGGWGLFRVAPASVPAGAFPDTVGVLAVTRRDGGFEVSGYAAVSPASRKHADWVQVTGPGLDAKAEVREGLWKVAGSGEPPPTISVRSASGGLASWTSPAGLDAATALAAAAKAREEADAKIPGRPHRRWRRQ
jgi:manganese oxidase